MKTSELTGAALDWAVAKCAGHLPDGYSFDPYMHCYSTSWTKGGPIIDRQKISIIEEANGLWLGSIGGCTDLDMPLWQEHGPTPLIAAMRCYVASKLGDNIDIPEELK